MYRLIGVPLVPLVVGCPLHSGPVAVLASLSLHRGSRIRAKEKFFIPRLRYRPHNFSIFKDLCFVANTLIYHQSAAVTANLKGLPHLDTLGLTICIGYCEHYV